ncbi:MAG: hypothetical protein CUN55_19035, partial [Phototrophicales bacterium]
EQANANSDECAKIFNLLGEVYVRLADVKKAREYFNQALTAAQDTTTRAEALGNLGMISSNRKEAIQFYEQALALFTEDNWRGRGAVLNNIGMAYSNMGKRDEALIYYQQALEIYQNAADQQGEGATLNNIAKLYDAIGDREKALAT